MKPSLYIHFIIVLLGFSSAQATSSLKGVRVAILSAQYGHSIAARNLASFLERWGISYREISLSSMTQDPHGLAEAQRNFTSNPDAATRQFIELKLNVFPRARSFQSIRRLVWNIPKKLHGPFLRYIREYGPTHIIATAPCFADMAPLIRAQMPEAKLAWILTDHDDSDLFTRLIPQEFDMTFFPSRFTMNHALLKGLDPAKARVTGIPVHPGFFYRQHLASTSNTQGERQDLGFRLRPSALHILVSGGSAGVGALKEIIQTLKQTNFQRPSDIVIVTGFNDAVKAELTKLLPRKKSKHRFYALGFVPDLALLANEMFDIWISKAGGVSSTEGAFLFKTIGIFSASPPVMHEAINQTFMVNQGVWLESSPNKLDTLLEALSQPDIFQRLAHSMARHKLSWLAENQAPWVFLEWITGEDYLNPELNLNRLRRVFPAQSFMAQLLQDRRQCERNLASLRASPHF